MEDIMMIDSYLLFINKYRKLIFFNLSLLNVKDFEENILSRVDAIGDYKNSNSFFDIQSDDKKVKSFYYRKYRNDKFLDIRLSINNEIHHSCNLSHLVSSFRLKNIKQLFIYDLSVIYLTEDDDLFVWGENFNLQLDIGNNNNKADILQPQLMKLPDNQKTRTIIISDDCSFAITNQNRLYGWGYGNPFIENEYDTLTYGPTEIILPNNTRIKKFFNLMYCLIINENDDVFIYMSTYTVDDLQFDDYASKHFKMIIIPNNEKVIDIKEINRNYLLLTELGNIYVFNIDESLLQDIIKDLLLVKLPSNEKAEQLICLDELDDLTICVTKNQNLFYWKKFWNSELKIVNEPYNISFLWGEKCIKTVCSSKIIFFYTQMNKIYIFGAIGDTILSYPICIFQKSSMENTSYLPLSLIEKNWNIKNHELTTEKNKLIIKTFLILTLKDKPTKESKYLLDPINAIHSKKKRKYDSNNIIDQSTTSLALLPKDIIIEILRYLDL